MQILRLYRKALNNYNLLKFYAAFKVHLTKNFGSLFNKQSILTIFIYKFM